MVPNGEFGSVRVNLVTNFSYNTPSGYQLNSTKLKETLHINIPVLEIPKFALI
jgi:hypothetical protein